MVIKTKVNTTLIYSDDSKRRYMMTIEWDKEKEAAAVIMLSAGTSDGITVDHTTAYAISNLNRLGYGSVKILGKHFQQVPISVRRLTLSVRGFKR